MKRIYRSAGAVALGWLIGSCGGGDAIVGPPPPPTTAIVTMSADSGSLVPAATFQLTATAKSAAGEALSRNFAWSTSDTAKVTVSSNGLVAGVAPGIATITAAVDGKSASATITVLDGGVVSPSGATLLVQSGVVQILVPAEAVASQTNLTVVASTSSAADPSVIRGTAFEFGPAGTSFQKAVSLRIKYNPANLPAGTEQAALKLHLSTSSGWEALPSSVVDTTAKIVSAEVSHFSTYAVIIPAPVSAIVIRGPPDNPVVAGASSLQVSGSEQLTATLTDSNGQILTDRLVTWASSHPEVATVAASGLVTALAPGSSTMSASAGGVTVTITLTVVPIPVASVGVTLAASSLIAGATTQATAIMRATNGDVLSGRLVAWTSSNASVATVSADGTVSAVSPGTAEITATSEGKSGTASITVAAIPVASVNVALSSNSITAIGTSQATATTLDANGNSLMGRAVAWSSSNTAVATVNATTGLVTAVSDGTVNIIGASEGKTGSATLTVTPAPVATVTVALAPGSITAVGMSQATATTLDANGNTLTGRVVTWSSGNNAVATVDAQGAVTAVTVGTASITATSEGKTGSATITVTQAPVATVTVSLAASSINAVQTTQATATLFDSKGRILIGRTIAWSSDNTALAAVSPSTGLVTAVSAGTANIVATSEGKTGSATLTVTPAPVATVTVSAPTTQMTAGATQQLTATIKDANGNVLTGRTITWASSNTSVLTVSASGSPATVTAVGVGAATITAMSESVSSSPTPTITVNPIPVASVTVSLAPTSITAVGTSQATATTLDANGNTLTGRVITWSSDNTGVATVLSTTGLVTAVSSGTANILATSEGKSGSASLTVTPAPVATVTLNPASANLVLGISPSQQLTAVLKDANGNVLSGRTVTWSSSNTSAAAVDVNGLVTAVGAGSATITATSEGKTGTSSITVTLAPVATVAVTFAASSVQAGQTTQATAATRDANGNLLTGRAISWSSDNQAVATVSVTGVVTAVAVGSANIIATSEGKTGSATATVTPVPVASVTVALSPTSITAIGTSQATATTLDANGNTLMGRAVAWSSSNAAVATVNATTGLVTAVSDGTVNIIGASEGKTGSATLTVTPAPVATVTVALAPGSITAVGTSQATATTLDANGSTLTGRVVTWSSGNNAVATVDAQGAVTAVAVGTASITATSEGKTGSGDDHRHTGPGRDCHGFADGQLNQRRSDGPGFGNALRLQRPDSHWAHDHVELGQCGGGHGVFVDWTCYRGKCGHGEHYCDE